jgi:hypothetical protein
MMTRHDRTGHLSSHGNSVENGEKISHVGIERKGRKPQEVTKKVLGTHVLLTRSLSGGSIPRRLLLLFRSFGGFFVSKDGSSTAINPGTYQHEPSRH